MCCRSDELHVSSLTQHRWSELQQLWSQHWSKRFSAHLLVCIKFCRTAHVYINASSFSWWPRPYQEIHTLLPPFFLFSTSSLSLSLSIPSWHKATSLKKCLSFPPSLNVAYRICDDLTVTTSQRPAAALIKHVTDAACRPTEVLQEAFSLIRTEVLLCWILWNLSDSSADEPPHPPWVCDV